MRVSNSRAFVGSQTTFEYSSYQECPAPFVGHKVFDERRARRKARLSFLEGHGFSGGQCSPPRASSFNSPEKVGQFRLQLANAEGLADTRRKDVLAPCVRPSTPERWLISPRTVSIFASSFAAWGSSAIFEADSRVARSINQRTGAGSFHPTERAGRRWFIAFLKNGSNEIGIDRRLVQSKAHAEFIDADATAKSLDPFRRVFKKTDGFSRVSAKLGRAPQEITVACGEPWGRNAPKNRPAAVEMSGGALPFSFFDQNRREP